MLEKLRLLQYRARIKLYRADQLRSAEISGQRRMWLEGGIEDGIKGTLDAGASVPLVYLGAAIGEPVWYPFLQGLGRSFAVRALLPPGLDGDDGGKAGRLDGIDDLDDLLFHYLDLLAALGLGRFDLVGASFGGRIAAELALRHPERVRRLVLLDAPGLDLPEAPAADFASILADAGEMRRLLFHKTGSFLGDLLLQSSPEAERARRAAQGVIARVGPGHPKLRARLGRIAAPTLVVWGAEDRVVPFPHAEAFRAAIPNARLTRIPDCGHLPMFEQEEQFVAAVTSFLRAAG